MDPSQFQRGISDLGEWQVDYKLKVLAQLHGLFEMMMGQKLPSEAWPTMCPMPKPDC